jgi:hypothetical protein
MLRGKSQPLTPETCKQVSKPNCSPNWPCPTRPARSFAICDEDDENDDDEDADEDDNGGDDGDSDEDEAES